MIWYFSHRRELILRLKFIHFFIISAIIHIIIAGGFYPKLQNLDLDRKQNPLKIRSIKTVGKKDVNLKDTVYVPTEIKTKEPTNKKQTPKGKASLISFSDLRPEEKSLKQPIDIKMKKPGVLPDKAFKSLSLNKRSVKNFLRSTPQSQNAGEFEKALGKSNVLVKLDVPKGVPEDELNKYELVFYSFRKRTALNYINSFYNELNEFSTTHPHLKFPMTEKEETLTGRVTYDQNGDVVKIKVLKWSNEKKLQDFFLEVLKDMNKLANPPKVIVKNGQFHIYYSLTLNSRIQ